jgi:SNF2 family DNA or RNA helicase
MTLQPPPAPPPSPQGLGKTVEVLGLILSNPPAPSVIAGRIDPESSKVVSRGTLVVCAVSLVGQWCTEAAKKLNGSLKMYPYHGSNR